MWIKIMIRDLFWSDNIIRVQCIMHNIAMNHFFTISNRLLLFYSSFKLKFFKPISFRQLDHFGPCWNVIDEYRMQLILILFLESCCIIQSCCIAKTSSFDSSASIHHKRHSHRSSRNGAANIIFKSTTRAQTWRPLIADTGRLAARIWVDRSCLVTQMTRWRPLRPHLAKETTVWVNRRTRPKTACWSTRPRSRRSSRGCVTPRPRTSTWRASSANLRANNVARVAVHTSNYSQRPSSACRLFRLTYANVAE